MYNILVINAKFSMSAKILAPRFKSTVARVHMSVPVVPSYRQLSPTEVSSYWRDGYVLVPRMFSPEEVGLLLRTVEGDELVTGPSKRMDMRDAEGRVSKLTLWSNVMRCTTYGAVASGERMVRAVTELIRTRPYHFHTKIMLKEPRAGGAWNVHQDFGYWYRLGCLNPDVMMSCILAMDRASLSNGCLQVLKGTHRIGRLEHGSAGEQAGADPRLVELAKGRYETVPCAMEPGDVLFTHSNLLHWSEANSSDSWRRSMIMAYNGVDNPPWPDNGVSPLPNDGLEQPMPDSAIISMGARGHAADAASIEEAGFLGAGTNVRKFAPKGQQQFKY